MDYEKRQLESLKYDLTAVNDYYLRLNRALEMDPDNEVLKKKVENRKKEMDELNQKITNLESLIELENNYSDKKEIEYNGRKVSFSDDEYNEIYNKKKDELLNLVGKKNVNKVSTGDYVAKHFKPSSSTTVEKAEADEQSVMDSQQSIDEVEPIALESNENITVSNDKKTFFRGQHFRPNNLDSEYVVFKKDGYLHIVGNFTEKWLKENYSLVVGDLAKDMKTIKLWNNIRNNKVTPLCEDLHDYGVKVQVDKDGSIKVIGDVDEIEYHNQLVEDDFVEEREGKHFKTEENQDRDMSGLDVIPDDFEVDNLVNKAEAAEPVKGRKITRKEAKPSLLKKAVEKFKGLKKWQKVAIIAGVIAVAGVGVFVVGPHIIDGINNLISPDNVDTVNQTVNAVNSSTAAATSLDYSSIGEGQTVFTNAYDAASNTNGVVSNEWFSNNPVDVFNTATNSYMGLTPEQLNDPNLIAELAKDPDNAMLFGNSISDPSGFVGLDDVVNQVTKIR